jgi:hypothetical protein
VEALDAGVAPSARRRRAPARRAAALAVGGTLSTACGVPGQSTPAEYAGTDTWTWDQFLRTARETTRGEGEEKTWGYGGQGRGTGVAGVNFWLPVVSASGGDLWNRDLTATTLDSEEALAGKISVQQAVEASKTPINDILNREAAA